MTHRNQDAQGVYHDETSILGCITDAIGQTTVELDDTPFPRPGTYHISVKEIVEDENNKCARLRCNIDEGPSDLVGRNFVTTLWFNSEGSIKWSFRTILRASTGERFPKGKFAASHIIKMMHDMKDTQFVFTRERKKGKTQTFYNDAFISLKEWADSKTAVPRETGPEKPIDQIGLSLDPSKAPAEANAGV